MIKKEIVLDQQLIKGQYYQIKLYSPNIVKITYQASGFFDQYENLFTNIVLPFEFSATTVDDKLIVDTPFYTLTYLQEQPISCISLKILVKSTGQTEFFSLVDVGNLGGLADGKGLISTRGMTIIDNSKNLVIKDRVLTSRLYPEQDYFICFFNSIKDILYKTARLPSYYFNYIYCIDQIKLATTTNNLYLLNTYLYINEQDTKLATTPINLENILINAYIVTNIDYRQIQTSEYIQFDNQLLGQALGACIDKPLIVDVNYFLHQHNRSSDQALLINALLSKPGFYPFYSLLVNLPITIIPVTNLKLELIKELAQTIIRASRSGINNICLDINISEGKFNQQVFKDLQAFSCLVPLVKWTLPDYLPPLKGSIIQLRNQLAVYYYQEHLKVVAERTPLIRAVSEFNYFIGSQILVVPITKSQDKTLAKVIQPLNIPVGTWHLLTNNLRLNKNNKYYLADSDEPLILVRDGGIIVRAINQSLVEVDIFIGSNNYYQVSYDSHTIFFQIVDNQLTIYSDINVRFHIIFRSLSSAKFNLPASPHPLGIKVKVNSIGNTKTIKWTDVKYQTSDHQQLIKDLLVDSTFDIEQKQLVLNQLPSLTLDSLIDLPLANKLKKALTIILKYY